MRRKCLSELFFCVEGFKVGIWGKGERILSDKVQMRLDVSLLPFSTLISSVYKILTNITKSIPPRNLVLKLQQQRVITRWSGRGQMDRRRAD